MADDSHLESHDSTTTGKAEAASPAPSTPQKQRTSQVEYWRALREEAQRAELEAQRNPWRTGTRSQSEPANREEQQPPRPTPLTQPTPPPQPTQTVQPIQPVQPAQENTPSPRARIAVDDAPDEKKVHVPSWYDRGESYSQTPPRSGIEAPDPQSHWRSNPQKPANMRKRRKTHGEVVAHPGAASGFSGGSSHSNPRGGIGQFISELPAPIKLGVPLLVIAVLVVILVVVVVG